MQPSMRLNAVPLSFEDCVAGTRVIVTTGQHRGKRAVIHHPIKKMVAIILHGERSTRQFKPSSLVYEDPSDDNRPTRQEPPRGSSRRGFFGRTNRTSEDSDDPDVEPTIPTHAGRRVHTRLQRAMLNQAYDSNGDFSRVVDDLTTTLVNMHFGSSTPVLEFIRDRIEDTEATVLDNNTSEGE